MSYLHALIAGIIQGLTEFLPISSSGHLVIFNEVFGESGDGGVNNLAFTVFLHLATLLAVVIVYHRDVWMLIRELVLSIRDIVRGRPDFSSPERRFLLMVIVATIPAVLVGGAIKLLEFDRLLENIFIVASMLIVTAVFMFFVDRFRKGKYTEANAPMKSALAVGILQAIAILPGLSRSGSTIFGGLLGGFRKGFAVKFAFILSIPAILGSALVELKDVDWTGTTGAGIGTWVIGFAAAFVCGIVSILFIKTLIKSNRFYIFGVYCLCASAFAFLAGLGVVQF